jgi:hypothetical protein
MSFYTDNGYANRAEYLDELREEYGGLVDILITVLPASEDFDGLVSELDDAAYATPNLLELDSMTNQHPITPPPELVRQWLRERPEGEHLHTYTANRAAQWGADQELEACVQWIKDQGYHPDVPRDIRAWRRSRPPTLKERIAAAITAGDEHTALSLLNEALPNG